jgi:hypothetical protein
MLDTNDQCAGTPQSSNHPNIPALPSHTSGDHNSMSPPLGDNSMTPDSTSNARQSQLSMIAASANEMVPQGLSMDDGADGMKMNQWNQPLTHQEQILFESLQEHDPSLTASTPTQRAASFPRPIAMNPHTQAKGFVNEFGNSTKPTKPKVRGRFSAERRREVQEVRKRGACIRCRMLKKPVRTNLYQIPAKYVLMTSSAPEIPPAPLAPVLRVLASGSTPAFGPVCLRSSNSTMPVSIFRVRY